MSAEIFANQVIDHCGSTNDLAKALGEQGYPHGTWISARSQDAGRGRLGRKWESATGNLFLSLIARIDNANLWTWVPITAAVGAAFAVRKLYPKAPIQLKWPNDLWLDRKKLGGLLCEAIGSRGGSFIVIGIGMNCAMHPEGLDQPTNSLSTHLGRPVVADNVRPAVISGILDALSVLQAQGAGEIARRFEAIAALPKGTEIRWQPGGTGELGVGIVEGLGFSGELKVRTESGIESLFAEDVKIRI